MCRFSISWRFVVFNMVLVIQAIRTQTSTIPIDILKGVAGMDENQVHLFKKEDAINHLYSVSTRKRHEDHHQVHYLLCCCPPPCLSPRRNSRVSGSVKGQRERKHMSPLIHHLNQRCQESFGKMEVNYRLPVACCGPPVMT